MDSEARMASVSGVLDRVSPVPFAENVGVPAGWFVLCHRWMPGKATRRRSHGRWFKIESSQGPVFRILRFSPNLEGSPAGGGGFAPGVCVGGVWGAPGVFTFE